MIAPLNASATPIATHARPRLTTTSTARATLADLHQQAVDRDARRRPATDPPRQRHSGLYWWSPAESITYGGLQLGFVGAEAEGGGVAEGETLETDEAGRDPVPA